MQVAVPSRTELAPYQKLARTVHRLVDQINERFGTDAWKPIHLLAENLPAPDVTAWYRLADFCLVSSLHDGMNLVAKEFVASKREADGVLLLSGILDKQVEDVLAGFGSGIEFEIRQRDQWCLMIGNIKVGHTQVL